MAAAAGDDGQAMLEGALAAINEARAPGGMGALALEEQLQLLVSERAFEVATGAPSTAAPAAW